jgi:hypothetical protein
MDVDLEIVVSVVVFISAGLGLGIGLRFLKWMTDSVKNDELKRVIRRPLVRFTLWLILGSLFYKPFMDCSSLLIESAKIPYMLMQPMSERSLPAGWEISHYALYMGIRIFLFGLIYGYALWMVPKIISILALEKGVSIKSHGFEGISIALASGSLLHALVTSVAFSIQQLPISAFLGNDDSTANYFIGWLIVFILLPAIMYGLNKIVNRKYESVTMLRANPS